MKKTPDTDRLEAMLRGSRISRSGFMGSDTRPLDEIIASDLAQLASLGRSAEETAEQMRLITEKAAEALGNSVRINETAEAEVLEAKGSIPCPWPHNVMCRKRLTRLTDTETGDTVQWSDLNIHLIRDHLFFEGHGSDFRIEPRHIVSLLFKPKG